MVRPRIDIALLAGIPDPDDLPRPEGLTAGSSCDIYLAFAGMPELMPAGYLIARKESINDVVAFCPLDPRRVAEDGCAQHELVRQLELANEIASHPEVIDEAGDAVWLGRLGSNGSPMPHWIYGLSCMPLTRKWCGAWLHPAPFCPKVFAAMLDQPKAAAWLRAQQSQMG